MLPNVGPTAKRNVDTEAVVPLGKRAEGEVLSPGRNRDFTKHSSLQRFYSHLAEFFQSGHRPPACSSHFQQSR